MIRPIHALIYRATDRQRKLQHLLRKKGEASVPHFWNLDERPSNFRFHAAGSNGKTVQVSGSSQPDESQIRSLVQDHGVDVFVDLREEPHGFVGVLDPDGSNPGFTALAISHSNFGNIPNPEIRRDALLKKEAALVESVRGEREIALSLLPWAKLSRITIPPQRPELKHYPAVRATTEAAVIQNINREREAAGLSPVEYQRVPITDELPPKPRDVDALVRIYRGAVAAGKNVHYHCVGGFGRTTTAMVMARIMDGESLNAALNAESDKNPAYGKAGHDLRKVREATLSDPLKLEKVAMRLAVLRKFSDYWGGGCGDRMSFKDYVKSHPITKSFVEQMKASIVIVKSA